MQKTKIKVDGFSGSWGVVELKQYENRTLALLEHEYYGDEAPSLIVEVEVKTMLEMSHTEFVLVMANVWNGFDDLDYELENGKSIGELIISHITDIFER
jgi:hypothetical protein